MVGALISVASSLTGGFILANEGEAADLGIAASALLLSILLLTKLAPLAVDPVPAAREPMNSLDVREMATFMIAGWIRSHISCRSPMIVFA
jgi:hypothetical protein